MKLILLGAPGSGKGTQAAYITDKYDLPHISTGDIFRENIKNQTPLGVKVKEIMDSGNLCPDDLTVELVKDRLNQQDCAKGCLLDGFPRNINQAKALDLFASPDKVINIHVDLMRDDLDECDFILIEDIVDSGRTFDHLIRYFIAKGAASVKTCTMLDKPSRRVVELVPDYIGVEIPDEFVVGFGLDYIEEYRNLPFVGVLKPEIYR